MTKFLQEKIQLIREKMQEEAQEDMALYVPLLGKRTEFPGEVPSDLAADVTEFLQEGVRSAVQNEGAGVAGAANDAVAAALSKAGASDQKVLLLLGDSGSGKSTYCRKLVLDLWEQYEPGNPIPVFISLPELEEPFGMALEETFSSVGFTPDEIAELKQEHSFVFVLDAFDELHQFQNIYISNHLDVWNAKIIVTCRTEFLNNVTNLLKFFIPSNPLHPTQKLLKRYVAPFNSEQIEKYLEAYRRLFPKTNIPNYKEISKIPGLSNLVTSPFLLKLTVESLPEILQKYRVYLDSDELPAEQLKLTQAELYDIFVACWFGRQEEKLKGSGHVQQKMEDIKPKLWRYCKALALQMREHEVTYVHYKPAVSRLFKDKMSQSELSRNPWDIFFEQDPETDLIRSACPIRRLGAAQYGFLHASFIEYFTTKVMYEEISENGKPIVEKNIASDDAAASEVGAHDAEMPSGSIYRKLFTKKPRMLRFLADRVEQDKRFRAKLFEIIEQSKINPHCAYGAANAISALNVAEVQFNHLDFSRARVAGAELSGGVFDHAKFIEADLSNVNFKGAWLRQSDLTGANLIGIQFGEKPYLKLNASACIFTQGGQFLAVAVENKIHLYDARSRKLWVEFSGHTHPVKCLTTDGEWLASGSEDKTIRIWNLRTRKCHQILVGHADGVNTIHLVGTQLASGSRDKTVRVWDINRSKYLRVLKGHQDSVSCLYFLNEKLISGSEDKTARLWDMQTGRCLRELRGYESGVTAVSFYEGFLFLAEDKTKTIQIFDIKTGGSVRVLQGHTEKVNCLTVVGDRLVSGSDDKTVRLWEIKTGNCLRVFEGHTSWVVSVSMVGELLATCGAEDNTVRLWDINIDSTIREFAGHRWDVMRVALEGEYFVSGGDTTVRFWNKENGNCFRTIEGHKHWVRSVSLSGDLLAIGGDDKVVSLWNLNNGKFLRKFDVEHVVTGVSLSGDKLAVASGGRGAECSVSVWNITTGECIQTTVSDAYLTVSNPSVVDFTVTDRSCLEDPSSDAKASESVRTFDEHVGKVSDLCLEGDRLLSWTRDGSGFTVLRLSHVKTGRIIHDFSQEVDQYEDKLHLSGEWLISGNKQGAVRLWNVNNGELIKTFEGHHQAVTCVTLAGTLIASGSEDKTIRLWEIHTGKCLSVIEGFPENVKTIALQKDSNGYLMGVGSSDKSVRCYEIIFSENGLEVCLRWASQPPILNIMGVCMNGAKGISELNAEFLKQRGAQGEPAEIIEDKAPEAEEKSEQKQSGLPSSSMLAAQGFFSSPQQTKQFDIESVSEAAHAVTKSKHTSCCVLL